MHLSKADAKRMARETSPIDPQRSQTLGQGPLAEKNEKSKSHSKHNEHKIKHGRPLMVCGRQGSRLILWR